MILEYEIFNFDKIPKLKVPTSTYTNNNEKKKNIEPTNVKIINNRLAYTLRYTVPHIPINKNIGNNILSNKKKNEKISVTVKDNNNKIKIMIRIPQYSLI